MDTVMGKTRARAISTVAWFFGERRVPQIAARVEQISEWRGFDVDTRRRIRKVWGGGGGGERLPLWQKTTEAGTKRQAPISATICSVLEAGWKPSTPGFWQAPEASATLDGALFNKAQIIESFSKDMETHMWKKAAGHPLSTGMEKGITTDFAKKATSQLITEGNFMAARALDFLVCEAIHEMSWKHTHDSIRPLCGIGAGILGHRSSFVCSWSLAARLVTCVRGRRMLGGQNVGKQWVPVTTY